MTVPATDTSPNAAATLGRREVRPANTVLSWTAASDPDAGDSVAFYRIYRDGTTSSTTATTAPATGAKLTYTDTATNGDIHTYYVVAVDTQLTGVAPIGSGVTK